MESIRKLPSGTVTGKVVLKKDDYQIEFLEIKHGAGIRYVERMTFRGTVVAFRATDEHKKEQLAKDWAASYIGAKTGNEQYVVSSREGL